MNMDIEILEEFPTSNEQIIVKGKRTKRPRPSSSSASSSGISTSTEEDEDMANCLILLARGGSPPQQPENNKFMSRRFTEMQATTTNGTKVGIYVYECKTCNRAFPSFQALGGHRASHKKPKPISDIDGHDHKKEDHHKQEQIQQEEEKPRIVPSIITTPPPLHVDHNKGKVHECSICGAEFTSGQALGGHMRKHRSSAPSTNVSKIDHNTSSTNDVGGDDDHKPMSKMLELDLNLPAPPEDEKFHQFPAKQPPSLVFSAATLVDCHY